MHVNWSRKSNFIDWLRRLHVYVNWSRSRSYIDWCRRLHMHVNWSRSYMDWWGHVDRFDIILARDSIAVLNDSSRLRR
jgi:hypothetical protein